MRYIVFRLDAGYAGMDSAEFEKFPLDTTDDYLDNEAWERALNHAESYGIYPMSAMPEDHDEDSPDWRSDEYTDNIEGGWEVYDPEKHDGLVVGYGPAFKD